MLYLLDANVLIDANRDYYALDRIPEYWDWLVEQGRLGRVKIPLEIYEEIKQGDDSLAEWIKQSAIKGELLLVDLADPMLVQKVVYEGYAENINDDELLKLGNDPFLIAHALASSANRCVVTTERSRPARQRANRHVPDVCKDFEIRCCSPFEMNRKLDFRTDWKQHNRKSGR